MRRCLALVALLVLAAPATADAARLAGRAWPGGVVRYAVADASLREPVRLAARAWNRSGIRVRLVETSAARAQLVVRRMPAGPCAGAIGDAYVGYVPGFRSRMRIQRSCDAGIQVMTAAHEFGHVLGLGHEDRRCALMNSAHVFRCRAQPLPWEYYCSPPRDDDRRGLLRLYGGSFRRAGSGVCMARTAPPRIRSVTAARDPVGLLARVRLSFRNPSTRVTRVVVSRRKGRTCADTPPAQGVPIVVRPRATPRFGRLVTEYAATGRRGRVEVIADAAVDGAAATYCYALFTLDARHRWRRAATTIVTLGGEDLAARIGLAVAAAPGGGVVLGWTHPQDPLQAVEVRRGDGPCPADLTTLPAVDVLAPPPPGAATYTDPSATPGPRCYALRFVPAASDARIAAAMIETTVPVVVAGRR